MLRIKLSENFFIVAQIFIENIFQEVLILIFKRDKLRANENLFQRNDELDTQRNKNRNDCANRFSRRIEAKAAAHDNGLDTGHTRRNFELGTARRPNRIKTSLLQLGNA